MSKFRSIDRDTPMPPVALGAGVAAQGIRNTSSEGFLMPENILGSLSPWQTLHEQFPVPLRPEVFVEYKDALVQVGRLYFENGEGVQVALTDLGFRLHVPNQFMPDICLPFNLVSTIEIEVGVWLRERVFNVRFDGDISIHLKLPEASEQFLISRISPQRFTKGKDIGS